MSKGKSSGSDWDYQELCKKIIFALRNEFPDLVPYLGDGIDVPLKMGGTTWTLDLALWNCKGVFIVVECKRWTTRIKQGHIAEFAYKLELLRKYFNGDVVGIFVAKTDYQIGAVKAAKEANVELFIIPETQSEENFILSKLFYDQESMRRISKILANVIDKVNVSEAVFVVLNPPSSIEKIESS